MRIAYFVNQYPKVSHSFIRREILALTRQGFESTRIALRGWDGELVDAEDLRERELTQYVLRQGALGLLWPTLKSLLRGPARFFSALSLAWRMSRHADRPWPYHLIYLAEACCVLQRLRAAGVAHLHAHFGTNSAEVAMLAQALGGPPYSFTVHGPEEFDKPEFIHLAEKIRRAAFVVAISSFGRSQLFRWAAHDQWHKVAVVHCGLEPAFHEVPAVPPPAAPRLVCVGRLCEQKGQLLLVEAVRVLTQRGVEVKLVLAGDGEMRRAVEQLIVLYGLRQRIEITGWISSEQVRAEILAAAAREREARAKGYRDRALALSARLTGQRQRLGNLRDLSQVADLKVTVVDVAAFDVGAGHFNVGESPALIRLLSRFAEVDTAYGSDSAVRTGLLPGAVLTVQNATALILSPVTALAGAR